MNENEKKICSVCGADLTNAEAIEFDGQLFCTQCIQDLTVVCECCGERIWEREAVCEDDYTLCNRCYEQEYTNCESCGHLISRDYANYDNEYLYCDECYNRIKCSNIHGYDYKPEPKFFGEGILHYGIELEIDGGGECSENALMILGAANNDESVLYAKHDGSLDEGFEIVSEPCTLDFHKNNIDWKNVMQTAVSMGYLSHSTETCGLHIHVNRDAFGETFEEKEAVVARIVYFVEHHWNELVMFSRRTKGNLSRWAARYATISESTQKTYNDAKKKNMGRYVAVNLTNYNTIEFRLFRGTLKYNTFIAALQLVDEICRFAMTYSDSELEDMSWSDFVLRIKDKPELISYLKLKRLYTNEPVEERGNE